MTETNDFLLAFNQKFDIVQLPFTVVTENAGDGMKNEYYEIKPHERLFVLGYTINGVFNPPIDNEVFSVMEQYFYKIGGMQVSFLKDKHFRNDTELFRICVRSS